MLLNAILAGFILSLLGIIALLKWRWGVTIVFVWLLIEDMVRRLLPGQPFEVTFIKEILIFPTYFSFFAAMVYRSGMKRVYQRLSLLPTLGLFLIVCILSMTYTLKPSIWIAALGVRSYFWYIPFALIGYFMFTDGDSSRRFIRNLVYTSIPLTLFAAFQLIFYEKIDFVLMRPFEAGDPVHSFLNAQIPFISSVFGSHGRYARFSLMLFFLSLGLLVKRPTRFVLVVSMLLSAVGVFLGGQRTPMYLLALGLFGFLTIMTISYRKLKKLDVNLLRMVAIGAGPLIIIAVFIFILNPLLGEYFFHFSSVIERFTEFVPSDIAKSVSFVGPYGMALGIGSQGGDFVAGITSVNPMSGIESGIGKIWYEIGFPGMFAFVVFSASLVYYLFTRIKKHTLVSRKSFAVAVLILYASILFEFLFLHHQVMGDATTLVPLWFFSGVVFGMERWPIEDSGNQPMEAV